jgi:hypothetical protein
MRTGIAGRVGVVVLAGGLVVACGGASGGGDIGSPGGSSVDATVDTGIHVIPLGGDDASLVDAVTTPPDDSGGPGPRDTGAADSGGDKGRDASPADGGAGSDGGDMDAAPDARDKGPFACGPTLMCDSKTQYCEHAASSTIIVVDSGSAYSCQALPACDSADVCSCLTTTSVTDSCTCADDGGSITRTCSCRVCASP